MSDKPTLQERAKRLESYLSVDVSNLALLSDLVELYIQLKDWKRAKALLDDALQVNATYPPIVHLMAVWHMAHAQFANALPYTQQLMDSNITADVLMYQHAQCLCYLGHYAQAFPYLESLFPKANQDASQFPKFSSYWVRALHAVGRFDEAIFFALNALAENAQDAELLGMLSLTYIDDGAFDKALPCAEAALALQSNQHEALLARGTVLLAKEQIHDAIDCFESVLEQQLSSGRAWLGLGLCRMLQGRLPEAIIALQKAVAAMPTHLGSYVTLAWAHIANRDHIAARAALTNCLQVDDAFADVYGTLAVLDVHANAHDAAQVNIKKALRLDVACYSAQYARVLLMAKTGQANDAELKVGSMLDAMQSPAGGSMRDMLMRWAGTAQQDQRNLPTSKA